MYPKKLSLKIAGKENQVHASPVTEGECLDLYWARPYPVAKDFKLSEDASDGPQLVITNKLWRTNFVRILVAAVSKALVHLVPI